jgi:hypothetical protein
MSANPRKPGAVAGVMHDRAHPRGRESALRRASTEEHLPARSARPASAHILDQRPADVIRQREPLGDRALAANRELPGAPVDVVQR